MVIVRRAVAAAAEATVDAMARGAREVTRGRTPRESVAARRFEEGSGSASEHKTNARRALRSDVHQTGKTRRVVSAGCRAVVFLPPAVFRRGRRASARPTHLSLAHAESEPKMSTSAELAAASARSGDAAPMDGERAPLLRAGASPSSRGDARRDRRGSQTHAPSRGVLAALGALAACGIIAVVYGASRAPPRARALGARRRAAPSRRPPRSARRRSTACRVLLPPLSGPTRPTRARHPARTRRANARSPAPLSPRVRSRVNKAPSPPPSPSLAQAAASPRPPRRSATRPRPRSRDARSAAWARRARGSSGKISPRISSVPPRSRPRRSRRASPASRSPTTASSSSCAGAPPARGPPRSARSRRTSWSSS